MTDMLLVYLTCDTVERAQLISRHLLKKKLCACVNIFPEMQPMFFWPPQSGKIDQTKEVAFIAKTIESKYPALELEVAKIHPDDVPCVLAIPVKHVSQKYYDWLVEEMN